MSEVVSHYKYIIVKSLLFEFFGLSLQVSSIGVLLQFETSIEKANEALEFLLPSLNLSESAIVILVSFVIMILYISSSLLIYRSRINILSVGSKYEELCFKRVVNKILSEGFNDNDFKNTVESKVIKLAKSDSRISGLIVKYLIKTIVPLLTVLVATIALIRLDTQLTILLLIPLIGYLVIAYKINIQGAGAARKMEESAKKSAVDLTGKLRKVDKIPFFYQNTEQEYYEKIVEEPIYVQNINHYEKRLRVTEENIYVLNILLALCLCIVVITYTARSGMNNFDWIALTTYIIALRYAHSNIKKVTSYFTSINRFYSNYKRYFQFVNDESLSKTKNDRSKSLENIKVVEIRSSVVLGRLLFNKVINEIINRNNLNLEPDPEIQFIYIDSQIFDDNSSIESLFNQSKFKSECNMDLYEIALKLGLGHIASQLTKEDYSSKSAKDIFSLKSKQLRALIMLSALYIKESKIVAIDEDLIRCFQSHERQNILKMFSEKELIFIIMRPSGISGTYSDYMINMSESLMIHQSDECTISELFEEYSEDLIDIDSTMI